MADKLFSETNGAQNVTIGEAVMMSRSLPHDVTINGARYLEASFLETDTQKFNTEIFNNPVNTLARRHPGYYSPVIFSASLNQFVLGVRASITSQVASVDAGLTKKASLTKKGTFPAIGNNAFTYSICEGDGLWLFGVSEGKIVTSPDLSSFTTRSTGFGGGATYVKVILYGSGTYIAAAGQMLVTSSDGINWSEPKYLDYPSTSLSGVYLPADETHPNGVFLIGANDGKIYSSTDRGGSFSEVNTPLTSDVVKIRRLNGKVYAVSSDKIAVSTNNGTTWQLVSNDLGYGAFTDISYIKGYFMLLRSGDLVATRDFITFHWVLTSATTQNLTTLTYDNQSTLMMTADNHNYAFGFDFYDFAAGNLAQYFEGNAKQYVRIS